jgi:hypothetical protein
MSGDQIGALPRRSIAEDTTATFTPLKIGAEVMRLALARAWADIGVVAEVGGNNRGPEVEAMIARQGGKPGDPWCMVAIQGWYQTAFANFNATHSIPRGIHVGRFAEKCIGKIPAACSTTPTVGAIALHYPDGYARAGHCGIVQSVQSALTGEATVTTIEGNTNAKGSRDSKDGDRVMQKDRRASYWTLFVDISRLDA